MKKPKFRKVAWLAIAFITSLLVSNLAFALVIPVKKIEYISTHDYINGNGSVSECAPDFIHSTSTPSLKSCIEIFPNNDGDHMPFYEENIQKPRLTSTLPIVNYVW